MSMRLCFLSLPRTFLWPEATIQKGDTLDECLPKDAEYWLSIIYETAFALKLPLYHHGTIRIAGIVSGIRIFPFIVSSIPSPPHQTAHIIIAFSALPVSPTTIMSQSSSSSNRPSSSWANHLKMNENA